MWNRHTERALEVCSNWNIDVRLWKRIFLHLSPAFPSAVLLRTLSNLSRFHGDHLFKQHTKTLRDLWICSHIQTNSFVYDEEHMIRYWHIPVSILTDTIIKVCKKIKVFLIYQYGSTFPPIDELIQSADYQLLQWRYWLILDDDAVQLLQLGSGRTPKRSTVMGVYNCDGYLGKHLFSCRLLWEQISLYSRLAAVSTVERNKSIKIKLGCVLQLKWCFAHSVEFCSQSFWRNVWEFNAAPRFAFSRVDS